MLLITHWGHIGVTKVILSLDKSVNKEKNWTGNLFIKIEKIKEIFLAKLDLNGVTMGIQLLCFYQLSYPPFTVVMW